MIPGTNLYRATVYSLSYKFKNLRNSLKGWNHKVFGNLQKNITKDECEVAQSQKAYEDNTSPALHEQPHSFQVSCLSHLKKEESFWKQK